MPRGESNVARDRLSAIDGVYDVAIIGGGALGCAMAWEAASRGLRTALIEREDFGSVTSANSLRIVHGGLRYLQKMDLVRARRSAAERSIFLKIAPHLVAPLRCAIPTVRSRKRGRMTLAAGLTLNALLTADRNRGLDPARRLGAGGLISLAEMTGLAPGIPATGWNGGACWYDAWMIDSERLCLAFAKSALQKGACVLNHMEATGIARASTHENEVLMTDRLSGAGAELRTRVIIDCRGTATVVGDAATEAQGLSAPGSPAVKAVNLVLDVPPTGCAVGFPARDQDGHPVPGRLFFALPYHGMLAVGTWYFPYARLSREPSLEPAELDTMLADLRSSTEWQINVDRIRTVHVGLLPRAPGPPEAPAAPTERPSIAREADCDDYVNLWRVTTEKWTTVRGLAKAAIDRITRRESLGAGPSVSHSTPIDGGDIESVEALDAKARLPHSSVVDSAVTGRLTTLYGSNSLCILRRITEEPSLAERMPGYPSVTRAELLYCLETELPYTLRDLVLRRLTLGATGCPSIESLTYTAAIMGRHLSWSDSDSKANIESVQSYGAFQVL